MGRAGWFALGLVGALWSLPNTLMGLGLAVAYGAHGWRYDRGTLTAIYRRCIASPGAQTWGVVIFYRDEAARADARLQRHERRHVRQGMIGGVLYLLAYAVHWLWLFAVAETVPGKPRWWVAYRQVCFERWARDAE